MYKVKVDPKKCIGCGACAAICEAVFEMKNGKAIAKKAETEESCVKDAAASCPVQAITVK